MIKVWTDLNTVLFSSSFRLTEPKISRFSATRNLELLNSLKSLNNTQNTKVPALYYVGCRLGQILHTIMNCSALSAHLFIRNLVESTNCICGITETVPHFLLI
jgi:hypothetical protein